LVCKKFVESWRNLYLRSYYFFDSQISILNVIISFLLVFLTKMYFFDDFIYREKFSTFFINLYMNLFFPLFSSTVFVSFMTETSFFFFFFYMFSFFFSQPNCREHAVSPCFAQVHGSAAFGERPRCSWINTYLALASLLLLLVRILVLALKINKINYEKR
jgi:hypothetical protein